MMNGPTTSGQKPNKPSLSGWLNRRWFMWWDARLTRRDQFILNHRNLYILPTRAGWSFAAVFLVLLLASINEQLNLGYALSFLLGGTAMAALYQTHGNLHGVSLRLLTMRSVHAGQVLRIGVTLTNAHRQLGRYGLQVIAGPKAPEGTMQGPGCPQDAELAPGGDCTVEIDVATTARGWLTLPRITIDTRFPLGLFRAWAYWRPLSQVLIWPALEPQAPDLPSRLGSSIGDQSSRAVAYSTDMPEGLRDYRRGDPMRWIAWKKSSHALASGTGLVSREPAQGFSPDIWLDFDQSPGMQGLHPEARLSRLASWLIQAEQRAVGQGALYGLRLPGLTVPCAAGSHHLRHCLDSLATWCGPDKA